MKNTDDYNDIMDLPHHVSANRPHMSVYDRAAQFSPFAALKGYDDEIDEAARLTESKREADGAHAEELNEKLLLLAEQTDARPRIKVTFFVADGKKGGGAYVTKEDALAKFDVCNRRLTLACGAVVPFENLWDIQLK